MFRRDLARNLRLRSGSIVLAPRNSGAVNHARSSIVVRRLTKRPSLGLFGWVRVHDRARLSVGCQAEIASIFELAIKPRTSPGLFRFDALR